MEQGAKETAMVHAIVALAKSLRVDVLARALMNQPTCSVFAKSGVTAGRGAWTASHCPRPTTASAAVAPFRGDGDHRCRAAHAHHHGRDPHPSADDSPLAGAGARHR